MSQPGSDLSRRLRSRHIQLIAIGGTIGVGLFLGSARAIHNAGPALVLAYALGGIAIFFIMRALGELLTYRPVAGSFATYADEFCGPFAGFVTGWSYWFAWIATAMAELTAIGVYVRWWLPAVPQWLPALVALLALYGSNLLAVRMFGELEFWFALIKVVAIVALIVSGVVVIVFHVGDLGAGASFSNLWSHGGFLPYGVGGMLLTMQIVMFAYVGVELIGVTAGEAQDPKVVLPRATNGIILRILIFYIGALIVIMALVPWNELSPSVSPFVFVFEKLRVPAAAGLINLVVITAASSSCNSGLFSTGRMLWSLAQRGHGPRPFARLSPRQVPAAGIHASAAVMLVGVALNYVV
ncbi:MAG: amino acid permease, partial [Gammaproteobacteria bacterium]